MTGNSNTVGKPLVWNVRVTLADGTECPAYLTTRGEKS
jgi:hypothetical protein